MKTIILLFLCSMSTAFSYRLLAIQNIPSRSHYNLIMGLVKPLLEAGHDVTLVTTFPEKKPVKNLRVIDMSVLQNFVENANVLNHDHISMTQLKEMLSKISDMTLSHPDVRHALTKESFDAVITEWFFSDVDAGYAAALKVPWMVLNGQMTPHIENLVDTARHVSTIPMMFNNAPIPMNLPQRMVNTIWYLLTSFDFLKDFSSNETTYHAKYGPIAEARGNKLPSYWDAIHDISVLFLNSHPSFTPALSLPPNVVEIGGYHIDDDIPPLPKDLQTILDSSKNGVIYFSMGSVIKSKSLPEKLKFDLVKMFAELPYTVLWKYEAEIKDMPKNLHIKPWMPQTSILCKNNKSAGNALASPLVLRVSMDDAHPNVKVFITHGGALSIIESVRFGNPILVIPMFGDQFSNADQSVRAGRAVKVPYSPDMTGDLKVALNEMLTNDSYYKQAQFLSSLYHKRPLPPRKLIANYVELAIESKGAYHLRSKTRLYKWYQIWMMDQAAIVLVVVYVLYRIFKKIVCVVKRKFSSTKKVKKQ